MKFAVNQNTIFQCNLSEYIDVCGQNGFKAVEISYAKLKDELKFLSPSALVSKMKKYEIKVLSINAFEDTFLVPQEGMDVLEKEALLLSELCHAIDSPAVVAPSGRWYDQYGDLPSKEQITKSYQEKMKFLKDIFDSQKVTFMFEPIEYPEFVVGETKWINEIMDLPGLKDIPLVPDIHNLYPNGEGPEQLKNYNNPIGIFHLDDTQDLKQSEQHVAKTRCFPGDGIADAVTWVKTAMEVGYNDYFSLELFDDALYEMSPLGAAKLCRQKLDIFEKILEQKS